MSGLNMSGQTEKREIHTKTPQEPAAPAVALTPRRERRGTPLHLVVSGSRDAGMPA